jgi:hypothetical protein
MTQQVPIPCRPLRTSGVSPANPELAPKTGLLTNWPQSNQSDLIARAFNAEDR